jgi:PAS domain S-box-containing protein
VISTLPTERTASPAVPPGEDSVVAQALSAHRRTYPVMVFAFDQEARRFLHLEGPCDLFFGSSRERMMENPDLWQATLEPFDRAAAASLRQELQQQGRVTRIFRTLGSDGRKRWLRASLLVHAMEGRRLVSGTVAEADHESELGMSNTFRLAMEHAREGLAVTDAQGCYVFLNREHVTMFGYESLDELIGRPWRIFYTDEVAAYIEREVFPELIRHRQWRGRLLAKRKDGSLFHEALALSLLPDNGIVCNCQDVTEQVQLSERLRNSETMFRTFLNTLPTGVTIRKLSGEYEFVNQATESFLERQVVNDPAIGICLSDSRVFAQWGIVDQRVGVTGVTERFDFPVNWGGRDWVLDVEKLPLRINSTAITHICTLVNDVTDQRRMERAAKQLARQRDEYLLMQREFISMVSHEFRTPLTSINGAHYLLAKKSQGVAPGIRDDLQRLLGLQERALSTLKELVDQVLLLNRIEHLSAETVLPPVRLAEFVRRIVESIGGSLASDRIELGIELPEELCVPLLEAQMRAAIENLVSNGLKYSPDTTRVLVKVGRAGDSWQLTVTDRGRGIPPQDRENLFRPFHRASNVGNVPGTGLGLTIIQRVVEAHRGTLDFKSELGVGTTFNLTFPLVIPPPGATPGTPEGALPSLPFNTPFDLAGS